MIVHHKFFDQVIFEYKPPLSGDESEWVSDYNEFSSCYDDSYFSSYMGALGITCFGIFKYLHLDSLLVAEKGVYLKFVMDSDWLYPKAPFLFPLATWKDARQLRDDAASFSDFMAGAAFGLRGSLKFPNKLVSIEPIGDSVLLMFAYGAISLLEKSGRLYTFNTNLNEPLEFIGPFSIRLAMKEVTKWLKHGGI